MQVNLNQNVRWVDDIKYELNKYISKQAICPVCSNMLNYNFKHQTFTDKELIYLKEYQYMECEGCKNLINFDNIHMVIDYYND